MLFRCSTSELHPVDHVSLGEQLSGTNDVEMVVKLAADPEPGSSGENRLFQNYWQIPAKDVRNGPKRLDL